jgi:IS30 family transposase
MVYSIIMKKQYQQLSFEEREQLHLMIWDNLPIREMARRLGRHHTTISREINRNTPPLRKYYAPHLAQARYKIRKRIARVRPRLKNQIIANYVKEKLKINWSPEQIAGRLNIDYEHLTISHEAIYQFIYHNKEENLTVHLRRRHKRRRRKYVPYQEAKTTIPNRVGIDSRPAEIELRMAIGHWETDSMVSRKSKVALNTLAERKSRLVKITKLNAKTRIETNQAIIKGLESYPQRSRQTITFDNGTENAGHEEITKSIGIKCYFANPYHSWERGTCENTNGLIRYYFPKGIDFATVSEEEIQRVEELLNNRPRKCLNYSTPLEVFSQRGALHG